MSWSPRPRSDECTLVKQVHALVRHGHTCSPKTCTYIPTYVKHMYVQKQKHAKRHSQHRHNKKDWFKLLTNAFQILLTRKCHSIHNQPTFIVRCLPLHLPVGDDLCTGSTRNHANTQTYIHTYVCAHLQECLSRRQLMVKEI